MFDLLFGLIIKLFFVMLLIGWIPALIARRKGRNFLLWWIYGGTLFLFAIIHSIIIDKEGVSQEQRKINLKKKRNIFGIMFLVSVSVFVLAKLFEPSLDSLPSAPDIGPYAKLPTLKFKIIQNTYPLALLFSIASLIGFIPSAILVWKTKKIED